jgi:YHS domain-containing protein
VTASSPKVEHNGKTYYFCCGGCDQKFAKDPEKYLKAKKPNEA